MDMVEVLMVSYLYSNRIHKVSSSVATIAQLGTMYQRMGISTILNDISGSITMTCSYLSNDLRILTGLKEMTL